MRAAVISDIHANLPALEAVLTDLEEAGVDELWCLGDAVGYGADPTACVDLLLERCSVCLKGNHDLAVLGEIDIGVFSQGAARAAVWTRSELADTGLAKLRRMGSSWAEREGIGLYHGSPRDPVWEYVIDSELAEDNISFQPQRVSLVGHSHIALFFRRFDGSSRVSATLASAGTRCDLSEGEWLINPGSVGQPRDGDPRAAWAVIDTDGLTIDFHRTEYPVERAAESILAAGLPSMLAERLFRGR